LTALPGSERETTSLDRVKPYRAPIELGFDGSRYKNIKLHGKLISLIVSAKRVPNEYLIGSTRWKLFAACISSCQELSSCFTIYYRISSARNKKI